MGLDTSHGCWHGAYSAFMRWRKELAEMVGIRLDFMEGFYKGEGAPMKWEALNPDALHILLDHSDSEGQIEHKDCLPLAMRLRELIAVMPDLEMGGHIGNLRFKTVTFVEGLEKAHAAGESVIFS